MSNTPDCTRGFNLQVGELPLRPSEIVLQLCIMGTSLVSQTRPLSACARTRASPQDEKDGC